MEKERLPNLPIVSREDDLIDFPCSNDWLAYYHDRGLTPRYPVINFNSTIAKENLVLRNENARLRKQLRERR